MTPNMKKILIALLLLSGSTLLFAQERVSVGGITFYLADGYSVRGRSQLNDGEVLRIAPNPNPDNLRLVIKVLPDALAGIDGLTSEEVSDMLGTEVDKLAGVVANTASSGYTLDQAYRIRFEDDARVPVSYTDLSGKDQNGDRFLLHAESALTDGFLITCCAIANNKGNLDDLVDIYREVMAGERDVPQGILPSHPVNASGITFDLYDHYTITQRDPMDPGEGLMIVPANGDPDTEQLYLLILPDILPQNANVSAERLSALLENSVRKLADVVVRAHKLNKNYSVTYDDSGLYPIAYANLRKGSSLTCHTETALVNGNVIGCCAVAAGEPTLSEMIGIYQSAVSSAR